MTLHLTVIAKAPVPGRVKTRLCPPCTPLQAARVAEAALADTVDAVRRVATAWRGEALRTVLLWDGPDPGCRGDGFEVVPQSAGDLGERLAAGFRALGPGLVVGMDTPAAVAVAAEGLRAVAAGRACLGPAVDGGYWAIGLPDGAPCDEVFRGVPMSTSVTGEVQRRRLAEVGLEVISLPLARDLDTFADLGHACAEEASRLGAAAREVCAAVLAGRRPGAFTPPGLTPPR